MLVGENNLGPVVVRPRLYRQQGSQLLLGERRPDLRDGRDFLGRG